MKRDEGQIEQEEEERKEGKPQVYIPPMSPQTDMLVLTQIHNADMSANTESGGISFLFCSLTFHADSVLMWFHDTHRDAAG